MKEPKGLNKEQYERGQRVFDKAQKNLKMCEKIPYYPTAAMIAAEIIGEDAINKRLEMYEEDKNE